VYSSSFFLANCPHRTRLSHTAHLAVNTFFGIVFYTQVCVIPDIPIGYFTERDSACKIYQLEWDLAVRLKDIFEHFPGKDRDGNCPCVDDFGAC